MSYHEVAKYMIDQLPEDKLIYIINILENIGEISGVDIYPEFTPSGETLEAIQEVEKMIATGTGEHFTGSTSDYFAMLNEE